MTSNGDGPAVAYVKQILTDPKAGWDLSSWNSGLPSGWNGVTCPYTIYESSEKNLWFWNHKMKINNEEWLTALRDYMMDVVSDLDFDGVLVSATKRQQYTNTGGPDTRLPVACNAIESTGTNLLFHWTKLGNAGVCHPGVPLLNQCFDSDSNASWDV